MGFFTSFFKKTSKISLILVLFTGIILYNTVPKDEIGIPIIDFLSIKYFKNYIIFKTCKAIIPAGEITYFGVFNEWIKVGEGPHKSNF